MDWKTHKKQLLKDPEFRKVLEEIKLEYKVARAVILARTKHIFFRSLDSPRL